MDDDEARNWTWIIQQGRNHKKKNQVPILIFCSTGITIRPRTL